MVIVAVLLLAVDDGQPELVTRTQKRDVPFFVYGPMVCDDVVAPAIGDEVLPLAPLYH